MKNLLLIISLTTIFVSCGKNNQTKNLGRYDSPIREESSQRPRELARDIFEVEGILREAAQRGQLTEYNNTRWFDHRNMFICRSKILDAQTFKIEMEY